MTGYTWSATENIPKSLFASDDGITWTLIENTSLGQLLGYNSIHVVNGELQPTLVEFGNGVYLRNSGLLEGGPDLLHMTAIPQALSISVNSVAANGKLIVAVGMTQVPAGSQPAFLVSTNGGISFLPPLLRGSAPELLKIRFLNDHFIAVGRQGAVARSIDGLTWESVQAGTTGI